MIATVDIRGRDAIFGLQRRGALYRMRNGCISCKACLYEQICT